MQVLMRRDDMPPVCGALNFFGLRAAYESFPADL
jgi:hypothetical protein